MAGFARWLQVLALLLLGTLETFSGRCLESGDETVVYSSLNRSIVLEIDNWESQRLITLVTQILLQEKLGLDVTLSEQPGGTLLYGRGALSGSNGGDGVDANMEVWPDSKQEARARWLCNSTCGSVSRQEEKCVIEFVHEAIGHSVMRVTLRDPAAISDDTPPNFWRSYKTQRLVNALPPATFDPLEGTDAEHVHCDKEYCSSDGRFYPFVCANDGQWTANGNAQDQVGAQSSSTHAEALGCATFLAMSPLWDPGVFEKHIDLLDLKLSMQYVGTDMTRYAESIQVALDSGADAVVYYSWTPSFLAVAADQNPNTHVINLPDQPQTHLTRIANAELRLKSPGAYSLIKQIDMKDRYYSDLLDLHPGSPSGQGLASEEDAACQWLRNHELVWQPWVEQAYADSMIKWNVSVGALFGLSDPWDTIEYNAALRALDHVNADDTLLQNINLQLVLVDISVHREVSTQYKGAEARDLVTQLQAAGAVASIGAGWSSDVKDLSPAVHNAEHALISQSATATSLSNSTLYPGFGRMCPPDGAQAAAIVEAVRQFGFRRVAVVHCDDAYCHGLKQNLEKELLAIGVTPLNYPLYTVGRCLGEVGDCTVPQQFIETIQNDLDHCGSDGCPPGGCDDGSTDMVAVIAAVQGSHYHPLMVAASETTLFHSATWIGGDAIGASAPSDLSDLGVAPDALMAVVPKVNDSTPMALNLRREYPRATDDSYAPFAYDTVWAVARAIDTAMRRGANIHSPSVGQDIVEALHSLPKFDGATGTVRLNSNGDRVGMQYKLLKAQRQSSANGHVWIPFGYVSTIPVNLVLSPWWSESQTTNRTSMQIPFCATMYPQTTGTSEAEELGIPLAHVVIITVACVLVCGLATLYCLYILRLRKRRDEATSEAVTEIERWTMSRSSSALQRQRAQQDQKPVSRRPVCYVPPLREECAALQLCAKCGAISQGRLDWQDIDEADTGREAVGAAAVVKATTDISGEKEDEIVASSGESATDMADKPDSEEDAIMHRIFDRTIFDRILGGGVGRELQPGSGSHRFYCTKCWRELSGDTAEDTGIAETSLGTDSVGVGSVTLLTSTSSMQP